MTKASALLASLLLSTVALSPVFAQMDHSKMKEGAMNMPQHEMAMTEGEVRKVDKDNGKITIKHGVIKNMDMPPMTMVFTVSDKALLNGVNAGDKILFNAKNEKGQMLVTDIKQQK